MHTGQARTWTGIPERGKEEGVMAATALAVVKCSD